jgi:DNA-binding IclR family transcriptional regulator
MRSITPTDGVASNEAPRYPISSVDNALRLLLLFREHRMIRVADASESLGVVRSTAHRLLAMLQYRGFVQQDPETKAYTAGPALLDIGLSVVRQLDIRRHVRPYLERLSEELGETVHLMVLDGANALFLDSVESSRALRTSSRVGRSYPAHTTSCGKVLLAELTPARLAELYPSERLEGQTPRSLSTRKQLLRELELVRERGYATNRGESEPDIAGVGVLLRNAFGQPHAGIGVSAPLSRLSEADVPAVAAAASRIAEEAAVHLG